MVSVLNYQDLLSMPVSIISSLSFPLKIKVIQYSTVCGYISRLDKIEEPAEQFSFQQSGNERATLLFEKAVSDAK